MAIIAGMNMNWVSRLKKTVSIKTYCWNWESSNEILNWYKWVTVVIMEFGSVLFTVVESEQSQIWDLGAPNGPHK